MRCPIETRENAELLLDYCARKLDPEKAGVLERHIATCPACREFRDAQKLLWDSLDQWDAQPVSPDFDRRLQRRIEQEEQRQGWWRRLLSPLLTRPAVPLTATACLVLAAGFILQNPGGNVQPVADSAVVREVEQVERTLDDIEMLRQFDLVARAEESKRPI
ncbi:MAG: zf-HC2 domain-containing protein [Acidobacteria bacterium]|nr:zf-HC2 domain-containing protein [Acidobacteriota bacterium]